MKKSRENKVKKLVGMSSQNAVRKDSVNCPFASDCDRISRGKFLKMAGVGAAAIGAAAMGMGKVAKATEIPPPPPPPLQPYYIGEDRTTLGNWYYYENDELKFRYGDCAFILGAMNGMPIRTELPVPHDGDYKYYDVYGGPLMQPDCGLDYKVYTCKTTTPSNCETRFLEDREGQYRRSTCWFTDGSNGQNYMLIVLDGTKIPVNAGKYELALYFLDSDGNNSRTQDITVTQGSNSVTQSISSFSNGVYLAFGIEGGTDVEIKITNTGPSNAVISGLFINPCGSGTSCTVIGTCPVYMGIDVATQGDWVDYDPVPADIPNWGKFWYLLCSWDYPNNVSSDPTVLKSVSGAGTWAWSAQCTQTTPAVCKIIEPTGITIGQKNASFAWSWGPDTSGNGLLIPPEPWEDNVVYPVPKPEHLGIGAWASCYDDGGENYPPGQGPDLYVDLTLPAAGGCSETSCYQVSFYATDYDSSCRRQAIRIYDPETGQLLAESPSNPSAPPPWTADPGFVGPGVYHTFFMPAGTYLVKIDYYGCTNAILSGIFVDCVECPKGTGDMRTIGYWKHQFAVATGKNKGKAQVSPSTLFGYLVTNPNNIKSKSSLPQFQFSTNQATALQQAYSILWPAEPASMCTRARQQLLALWLNWACGAVNWNETVYDIVNGEPVQFSVLMPQLEAAIPGDCSWPHSTADWLNNSGYE